MKMLPKLNLSISQISSTAQVNEMMRWADKDGDGKVGILTFHSRSHMTTSELDKLAIITSFGWSVLHKVPFDFK